MRLRSIATAGLTGALVLLSSVAEAQSGRGFVGALGGGAFGDASGPVMGIQAGARAWRGLQVIGEAGRIDDLLSDAARNDFEIVESILTILEGAPVEIDANLRASYGVGGLRWMPRTAGLRPFVETAIGATRLRLRTNATVGGADASDRFDAELGESLEATKMMFLAGGGLQIAAGGRWSIDAGYRYVRVSTEEAINAQMLYGAAKIWF